MYKYKIEDLEFSDSTLINPGGLTLIVGPNNSGKSRILRDIVTLSTGGKQPNLLVKSLRHSLPSDLTDLLNSYKITTHTNEHNQTLIRSLSANLVAAHNQYVDGTWKEQLDGYLKSNPKVGNNIFLTWLGNIFVSMFSTEERLRLIKECQSCENGSIETLLQAYYFEGGRVEDRVREIVRDAFKKDIRLDFSSLRKILLRIGDDLSSAPQDPRDAVSYYENTEKLDDQGDGIKSFIATVLAMLVENRPVILLDEPEAFLHPPQAFRLGEIVAQNINLDRQIFIATHSSEFLRGVLSKTQDVTILRTSRVGNNSSIKLLNTDGVKNLATDPILSSTRVIDGLFYEGVVIVESDSDSVFYKRISRQLPGTDNFHIVHAHNKQTVSKVLEPYQTLGVPYAAIVDFDVIRVGVELSSLLDKFNIEPIERSRILGLQVAIAKYIERIPAEELLERVITGLIDEIALSKDESLSSEKRLSRLLGNLKRVRESGACWKESKKLGKDSLDEAHKTQFEELWMHCAARGLFIVPVGELEGWLSPFGLSYTSNKSKWIVSALELIPSLRPSSDINPWKFLNHVFDYLKR
jgi:AAA domain, putative AbiEii toxin, Type IV TA system